LNEVNRRIHMGTRMDAKRKLGDGCRVASVETLRLPQFDARIAGIVDHLVSDPDSKVDPPVITRRPVKKDVPGVHARFDLVRSFSNP
jgi:hypothetical protein